VTVCDNAAKNCPAWLGRGRVMHIGFPDPAAAAGTQAEQLDVFRHVRDDIRQRILDYLDRDFTETRDGGLEVHLATGSL
jgi:arsenate reductase